MAFLFWLGLVIQGRSEVESTGDQLRSAFKHLLAVEGVSGVNPAEKQRVKGNWSEAVGRHEQARAHLAKLTWWTYKLRLYAPCSVSDYGEPIEIPDRPVPLPEGRSTKHLLKIAGDPMN